MISPQERHEPPASHPRGRHIGPLLLTLLAAACLSPLDRFAGYSGGQLVISGQVSSLEEANTVYVGMTSDRERLPAPIPDAKVTLVDERGQEMIYQESGGKYTLTGFQAVPGKSYHIRVALRNGKVYESLPETVPSMIGNDQVYYDFESEAYTDQDGTIAERRFLRIFTNHVLPATGDPVYLKWTVDEVYQISPTDFPDPFGNIPPPCYIHQQVDPQKVVLFDTEEVNISSIQGLHVASRLVDPSFKERHYFMVYQSSLSRNAYEYWRQVDIVANQVGSIFDAPPARIKGNVFNTKDASEEVFGYFQAVRQSFYRFYLTPDDLPFRQPLHCEFEPQRNYNDYPSECLDCTSVRNSSHTRPTWF